MTEIEHHSTISESSPKHLAMLTEPQQPPPPQEQMKYYRNDVLKTRVLLVIFETYLYRVCAQL